jgi:hypothetical protein
MHDMTDRMMWGMEFLWLFVTILVLLGVAALVKYFFFTRGE